MEPAKFVAIAEAVNTGEVYHTELLSGKHFLIADEPKDLGGNEEGPSPGDYICMSLASCKVITMRMYANRKNWSVGEIRVRAKLVKGTELESGNNTFFCEVELKGDLTDEQKTRLMEIAKACPIQRMLSKPVEVLSELV